MQKEQKPIKNNAKKAKTSKKQMQKEQKPDAKEQKPDAKEQKPDAKPDIKSNAYLFPIRNFPAESFLAPCNSLGCICFTHKWLDSSSMTFDTLFLECASNCCLRNICG